MRVFGLRGVVLFLGLALFGVLGLSAQDSASITGTVTDSTGAVIPGATVVLTNPATGQTFKATTNSIGAYVIPNVPPGPNYKETVSHDGFETEVVEGIYLNVATTRSQNVKLSAGKVTETVAVSASAQDVTLNTTDASIGNNFQVTAMNDLPVMMRDSPTALLYNQPGMTTGGSATGARTDQSRMSLDGLDVTDMTSGAVSAGVVGNAPVDSVQEFRGTTAGMTADEGAGGGGQFSMVTKSGSNQFHGNLNEYHRDTDLEANEWFSNFDGVPRSPLIRNQFGGQLSGPIWKNKIFFMFDYNARRDTVASIATRTVPTASFLPRPSTTGGDCTTAAPGNTSDSIITYDTSTGGTDSVNAAYVQNKDPQGIGISAAEFGLIGCRYPTPNDFSGDAGDLLNTAGYRFNWGKPVKENNYVGRLDYQAFASHHLFARVSYNKVNQVANAPQFPGDPETWPSTNTSHAWVVGWDWTIGANKTNSLIWGANINKNGSAIAYNPQGPNQYAWDGNPEGGSFLSGAYASASGSTTYFPIPIIRDDFSWVKGRHNISIGGDFKYPSPQYANFNNYNGPLLGLGGGITGLTDADPSGWDARPTDLARTENGETIYDSAFVFGLGRFASVQSTFDYTASGSVAAAGTGSQHHYKYYEYEFYGSDSWQAFPNLTLTFGLRYQNFTVPYEVNGIEAVQNLDFDSYMATRIAQSAAGVSGDASLPGAGANAIPYLSYNLGGKANHAPGFFKPSGLNLAPRLAFAWTPYKDHKTVINGGFGIVYDQTVVNALMSQESNYNYLFSGQGTLDYGSPISGTPQYSKQYLVLQQNPRFTSLAASSGSGPTAPVITKPFTPFVGPGDPNCATTNTPTGPCGLAEGGAFNISVDKNLPTPYNMLFNFGIQQEFKGGYILKLNYVGRQGRRLLGQADSEQLLDFPDKASGQTMSQAMAFVSNWLRQNPNADPTTIPAQPWFENVLYNNGGGISNTAYVATATAPYPVVGDFADTIESLSADGVLPANVGMAAQLSENTFFTDRGFSGYNGLLATLHKNTSHGLSFDLNYTFSHALDNVSLNATGEAYGGYGFICDITRPRLCRASSDFDIRQEINGQFSYQLPFGRGRDFGGNIPWWLNEVAGGWDLSGIPTWRTGTPFMANSVAFLMSYSNEDPAILTGTKGPLKQHVTKTGGQVYVFKDYQQAFNQYTAPVGFQMGPRNNLSGPHFFDLDLGVGKTFPVYHERWKFKFRADAFNALNHPNFSAPSFTGNMNLAYYPSNDFGVIPSTVTPNGSDLSARVLQGSLRLEF